MPRLSVWFVRASIVYLVLGFIFGALMLAEKGIPYMPLAWALLPVHIEFLMAGWLLQLALGVAFWILPRLSPGPPRGDERLVWSAFFTINAGIILVAAQLWAPAAAFPGRALEVLGVLLFVSASWGRVRAFGAS
jgi:hypothetical protein